MMSSLVWYIAAVYVTCAEAQSSVNYNVNYLSNDYEVLTESLYPKSQPGSITEYAKYADDEAEDSYHYHYSADYAAMGLPPNRRSQELSIPNTQQQAMEHYRKSYSKPQKMEKEKIFVPVVIKKKSKKKKKIISVHKGFYVPGGTQMFGKFKDLFSCKKACEITPTCFAGDFNPWLGRCYLHGNLTACANMRSHKAITHFKKVPCDILETTRGYVVLGASVINGIEIKGVNTLSDCIKKCATAGGGVATKDSLIVMEGQVCCHLDYDFATHKCYFHPCVDMTIAQGQFCYPVDTISSAPINAIANPTTISITICPLKSA